MQESLRDPAGLLERAPELAELAQADASVRQALAKGDPRGVYRALWWARLLGRLKPQRAIVDALLEHRRLFAVPFKRSPALGTMNGVGAMLYGDSERDADGTYVKSHFLVFVFVPIFPFAQYLVKDADGGGWFVIAKVPTSLWLRLWRGGMVAAAMTAMAVAAVRVVHSSRYHDVHVVNALPVAIGVQMGGVRVDVPAGDRRVVTLPVGRHPVATSDASGRALESGEIAVDAGAHVLVWNVLGAGSVFDRTVVYSSPGASVVEDQSPHFHCGERAVRLQGIDCVFTDPPQSVSVPQGQPYGRRRVLGVSTRDANLCAGVLAQSGDAKRGVALAHDLVRLGDDASVTVAIGLLGRLGPLEEAVGLARQAASRPESTVDQHRTYQDLAKKHGLAEAVRAEYRARAQATPNSADAGYLYARTLPTDEAYVMSEALVRRFPESVPCVRLRLYGAVRSHRFAEAVPLLEQLHRLAPIEWQDHVEEHAAALASLRRRDDARALLEASFEKASDPQKVRLAAIHHWLGGGPDPMANVLYRRLGTTNAADAQRFRIRFWEAPKDVALQPGLPLTEHALHRLALHAHFDPAVALRDVATVPADEIASLDPEVLVLLLGEASRNGQPAIRARLDAAATTVQLPLLALVAYLERAEWSEDLEHLSLPLQGAAHFARARRPEIAASERDRLRALAARCDPLGGFVAKALAAWPAP